MRTGLMAVRIIKWTVALLALMILLFFALSYYNRNYAPHHPYCRWDRLRTLELLLTMYQSDHEGSCPALSPIKGEYFFAPDTLYPDYLTDPICMVRPMDPYPPDPENTQACLDDDSYIYLGYAITNETEAHAFLEAYKKRIAEGGSFEDVLPVSPGTGTGGGDVIQRLNSNMKLFNGLDDKATEQLKSGIPIMFDRKDNHPKDGINVLYMEGHARNVKISAAFPDQEWFLDALEEMEK